MVVIRCWTLLTLLAGGEAAAEPEVFQIRFHVAAKSWRRRVPSKRALAWFSVAIPMARSSA
jgi:hypothetical protein